MTTSKYVAYAYNRGSSNGKVKGWLKIIIFGIDLPTQNSSIWRKEMNARGNNMTEYTRKH
jgi:hypothetical protein